MNEIRDQIDEDKPTSFEEETTLPTSKYIAMIWSAIAEWALWGGLWSAIYRSMYLVG